MRSDLKFLLRIKGISIGLPKKGFCVQKINNVTAFKNQHGHRIKVRRVVIAN